MEYELSEAKIWARETLRDYVAVTFTPYLENGEVDENALRSDVEYTVTLPGVRGLYVGSIYQEFWTLSLTERKRVAEIVIDQAASRVPVIVSATHNCMAEAVELGQHASRSGASLVMLWPPYFGPRSDEEIVAFYEQIMAEVPIGFAFYNSGLAEVGHQIGIEGLKRLAAHPKMCILKEASLRLDTYLSTVDAIGDDVLVSSPLEDYWLAGRMLLPDKAPRVLMGSSRVLFLQTPEKPALAEFLEAAKLEKWEECQRLLLWVLRASEAVHSAALRGGSHPVGLIKGLRRALNQSGGRPRPPCPRPSEAEVQAAVRTLQEFGVPTVDCPVPG